MKTLTMSANGVVLAEVSVPDDFELSVEEVRRIVDDVLRKYR